MNEVGLRGRSKKHPVGTPIPAQEAESVMARVGRLIVAASTLAALCGCAGPGWYRAAGSIPGVAWTDYAFTFFCDTATQLFPATPPQVESSMLEALADMGFRDVGPPTRDDASCMIPARAPDGRRVRITIRPQNAMTMVAVVISPCLGDYQLSRDLLRRVALNFGTAMRVYTPVETTLPRKIVPPNPRPKPSPPAPPELLEGEGLRPDLKQQAAEPDELTVPGSVVPPIMSVPGIMGGYLPSRSFPNPPNMPYAPWPYSPYNDE